MKKYFSALLIFCMVGAMPTWLPQATAKTALPKKAAKPAAGKDAALDDDEGTPDIGHTVLTEFHCELGNKLTIYTNVDDTQHIALRWRNVLHRLTRIATTTGAERFENRKYGLVWINIPTKGMLLDSKHGQQLANECKNPQQSEQ